MPGMSITSWETEAADHKSPNISSLITSCHLAGAKKKPVLLKRYRWVHLGCITGLSVIQKGHFFFCYRSPAHWSSKSARAHVARSTLGRKLRQQALRKTLREVQRQAN